MKNDKEENDFYAPVIKKVIILDKEMINRKMDNGKIEVGHCIDCCKKYDTAGKCSPNSPMIKHLPKDKCPFCQEEKMMVTARTEGKAFHRDMKRIAGGTDRYFLYLDFDNVNGRGLGDGGYIDLANFPSNITDFIRDNKNKRVRMVVQMSVVTDD
jgi:hypothetical protein